MRWLLSSVKIVEPGHALHGKKRDILIEDGKITRIASKISDSEAQPIKEKGLCVSSGWVDSRATFRDPGNEYKEGLLNGLDAASAGGFTHVALLPSTQPVVDNKGQVQYMLARSQSHAVRVLPTAMISKQGEGKQLAELYDLHKAGAVGFTDGFSTERSALLLRALEYTRNFSGLVISVPQDSDISGEGVMHEGKISTTNGLKGIPTIAETTRVKRDIDLVRYTGGRLHFALISSAESVKLIREAKKEGLDITCGVTAHHLYFNDDDLEDFDSNLKVLPPLRSNDDRKALLKGVKDGVIDVICSDHQPEDVEHKKLEFQYAQFGIGAIEQTFSAALSSGVELDDVIKAVCTNPRKLFNLDETGLEEGNNADITLFFADQEKEVEENGLFSKSWNNPYLGKKLRGDVFGIVRGAQVVTR